MHRSTVFALLALVATPLPATAGDTPTPYAKAFAQMRLACEHAASSVCANRTAALLDGNGDGGIDRRELAAARDKAVAEAQRKESGFTDSERGIVAIAVAALDSAGLDTVFDGFDANRDGRLDRAELFADFKVGTRPFTEIVGDPKSVDWTRFANRFGKTGRMFLPLLLARGDAKR